MELQKQQEMLHLKAREYLDNTTAADRADWLRSPCTQYLIYSLKGDQQGILAVWLDGGYSNSDSIDATAQQEAKARGLAQATQDILETITGIVEEPNRYD